MSTKPKKPVKSKKGDPNEKIAREITEANKTENPTETLKKASAPPAKSETWEDRLKAERSELAEKIEKAHRLDLPCEAKKVCYPSRRPTPRVAVTARSTIPEAEPVSALRCSRATPPCSGRDAPASLPSAARCRGCGPRTPAA